MFRFLGTLIKILIELRRLILWMLSDFQSPNLKCLQERLSDRCDVIMSQLAIDRLHNGVSCPRIVTVRNKSSVVTTPAFRMALPALFPVVQYLGLGCLRFDDKFHHDRVQVLTHQ